MMGEAVVLFSAALATRAGGTMVRGEEHAKVLRVMGWVLCAVGAWLAAGAMGAWSPIWPALLLGTVVGVASVISRMKRPLAVALDAGVVMTAGLLSVPQLDLLVLIAVMVAMTVIGMLLDEAPRLAGWRLRVAAFSAPLLMLLALAGAITWRAAGSDMGTWFSGAPLSAMANIGLSRPLGGERVTLEHGAIGWLYVPWEARAAGSPTGRGAIILHGAHRLGSKQGSACVLRRALLDAGYIVLCIDHPGFGASPPPEDPHRLASWDSLPIALSAVKVLESRGAERYILAAGHSMGSADALRLLAASPQVNAAAIFGAAGPDPAADRDMYWYRRFHSDRDLAVELDEQLVREIRHTYYDATRSASSLRARNGRVIFVSFGIEHPNIVQQRDEVYEAISQTVDRTATTLPECNHYFNAFNNSRFALIGDTRVPRMLSEWFRSLVVAAVVEEEAHVPEPKAVFR